MSRAEARGHWGRLQGFAVSREPLNLYYSRDSLKSVDGNLTYQNFLPYVSGQFFLLDSHCILGPPLFKVRFTVALDHSFRGKYGSINTTQMPKVI